VKDIAYGEIVAMYPLDIRGIGEMKIEEIGYADQEAVRSEYVIDESFRIYKERHPGCVKVKCVGAHMYLVEFSSMRARRNCLRARTWGDTDDYTGID